LLEKEEKYVQMYTECVDIFIHYFVSKCTFLCVKSGTPTEHGNIVFQSICLCK